MPATAANLVTTRTSDDFAASVLCFGALQEAFDNSLTSMQDRASSADVDPVLLEYSLRQLHELNEHVHYHILRAVDALDEDATGARAIVHTEAAIGLLRRALNYTNPTAWVDASTN